jgi:UDP-N-acetyl-D-glucosamine dehydrogenase
MDRKLKRGLNGAKILVLGIAYKKNVDDMRESPSLKLIELLEERGAEVHYHDPFIPVIPRTREHAALADCKSISLDAKTVAGFDSVLIATDHDRIDYKLIGRHAKLIVDTRNACARAGLAGTNIVRA